MIKRYRVISPGERRVFGLEVDAQDGDEVNGRTEEGLDLNMLREDGDAQAQDGLIHHPRLQR